MIQTTIFDAFERGNRGMTLAAEKADREYEGWTTLAYAYLKKFISTREKFWPWQVVDQSIADGIYQPENLKSWGLVYKRAAKDGLIVQGNELAKHPRRHGTKVPVWLVVKQVRQAA
jgi:hypothetical protein